MNPNSKISYLKIGMIPLLLCILYAVLPTTHNRTDALAVVESKTNTNTHKREGDHETKGSVTATQWPTYLTSEIGQVDPFDRRRIFPESNSQTLESETQSFEKQSLVRAAIQSRTTRLESLKVQAVFQSPKGIAALVGERVLHVGDLLEDGTEVVEITPEQIVLGTISIH